MFCVSLVKQLVEREIFSTVSWNLLKWVVGHVLMFRAKNGRVVITFVIGFENVFSGMKGGLLKH